MLPYLIDSGRVRLRRLRPGDADGGPDAAVTALLGSYARHPLHDRVPYGLAVCASGSDRAAGTAALVPEGDAFRLALTCFAPEHRPLVQEAAVLFAAWMPQRFGIRRILPPRGLSGDGAELDCGFSAPEETHLSDGCVTLERTRLDEPDVERGYVGTAFFDILAGDSRAGSCSLRCGYNEALFWNGHISYTIFPAHRGHGLAARAARLLIACAGRCGMPQVSICCLPGNEASRRTALSAGCTQEGLFPIPPEHPLFSPARTHVLRHTAYPKTFT